MLRKTDSPDNFFESYIKKCFLPQDHGLPEIKENIFDVFIQQCREKSLVQESFSFKKRNKRRKKPKEIVLEGR